MAEQRSSAKCVHKRKHGSRRVIFPILWDTHSSIFTYHVPCSRRKEGSSTPRHKASTYLFSLYGKEMNTIKKIAIQSYLYMLVSLTSMLSCSERTKVNKRIWQILQLVRQFSKSSNSILSTVLKCIWSLSVRSRYHSCLFSRFRIKAVTKTKMIWVELEPGILQARILQWVAIPLSRVSSQPRDQTWVSHIAGGFFTVWATRKALW